MRTGLRIMGGVIVVVLLGVSFFSLRRGKRRILPKLCRRDFFQPDGGRRGRPCGERSRGATGRGSSEGKFDGISSRQFSLSLMCGIGIGRAQRAMGPCRLLFTAKDEPQFSPLH